LKGVISSGDKTTSSAGAKILKEGGNAFDAVCAAMLISPLSEPMLTSLGGGGFLMSHEKGKKPELYDFFVDVPPSRTPRDKKDFYPIDVDFGTTVQEFHIGTASIAIPGVLKGIYQIHKEKGKLPFSDVAKPAIQAATNGIYLSQMQASFVKLLIPILTSTKESTELFMKDGNPISHTDLYKNPQYAQFLREFVKYGDKIFYDGSVASDIENLCNKMGGDLKKEDLKNYKIIKREPIEFKFREFDILTNTTPSAGGILIAFALKILEKQDLGEFASDKHISNLIEAMVTTSDFRHERINEFLHKEGLADVLKEQPLMDSYLKAFQNRVNLWGNTTHISVLDEQGNAATVTTTNGEGSGIIAPNTGIMLNNMLGEEDLNPHGFFSWPSGVRLPSMMAPTLVLKDNIPHMILGSAGSNRIRSAITQAILNYTVFGHAIDEVCNEKRVHFEKGQLFFEPGFSKHVLDIARDHYDVTIFDEISVFFGGVNAVTHDLIGGSDPRRGGETICVK
jgi:gamma-glutamyltranspeptidase/glutathione hydrolase